MLLKGQPKDFSGKPLISEGKPDLYLGRVIIELWEGDESHAFSDEPNFAWSLEKSNNLSNDEWLKRLFNGLQRTIRHIADTNSYVLPDER